MRICVVTVAGNVHSIGGMQDHTDVLVRGLVARGHEVEVVTARHPDGLKSIERDGVRWHFVDATSARKRLPMRAPAWLRLSAERFEQLHAKHPFDLVHSESTSAVGLLQRGWHRRLPVVAKFHGNYLSFVRENARRVMTGDHVLRELKGIVWISGRHFLPLGNWFGFRSCEAMVPSRAQLEDTVRSHLLRRSNVHVVPNGIDADMFSPGDRSRARSELGLGDGVVFAWLGRMYPAKGVDVAVRALAQTAGTSLLLVGDGESRGELEALATRMGVHGRVVFAGLQPQERIPLYLRSADALVFPSVVPEAAPFTPLQAMSCGVPVIASTIGAIPEVVDEPGMNGLLVKPGDVVDLARSMTRLARDERLRLQMGAAGRDRVLAEYTIERMIERILAVYGRARSRFESER